MKKLITVLALATSMGVAYADEPVALTDGQMDMVSAGGFAFSNALANAFGVLAAATQTITATQVDVLLTIPTQAGQITVDQAQSWSTSSATAL
jgi:uncharacterized protein